MLQQLERAIDSRYKRRDRGNCRWTGNQKIRQSRKELEQTLRQGEVLVREWFTNRILPRYVYLYDRAPFIYGDEEKGLLSRPRRKEESDSDGEYSLGERVCWKHYGCKPGDWTGLTRKIVAESFSQAFLTPLEDWDATFRMEPTPYNLTDLLKGSAVETDLENMRIDPDELLNQNFASFSPNMADDSVQHDIKNILNLLGPAWWRCTDYKLGHFNWSSGIALEKTMLPVIKELAKRRKEGKEYQPDQVVEQFIDAKLALY
jgi:hypothetical protein